MPLLTHTCRRGGIYHFRIRIPRDLVVRFQQKELKASLRTTNPNVARNRSLSATQHCLRLFDLLRRDVMLRPDQIRELAQSHFQALLQQDLEERRLLGDEAAFDSLPVSQRAVELVQRRRQLACQDFRQITALVAERLHDAGLDVAHQDPEFQDLCTMVLRATVSAIQCQQYRDAGNFHSDPDDDLFRQASAVVVASRWNPPPSLPLTAAISPLEEVEKLGLTKLALKPLSEFVEHVINKRGLDGRRTSEGDEPTKKQTNPNKKTVAPKYRAVVRALIAVAGDKLVYQYIRRDFVSLKDTLMKTPTRYTQRGFDSVVDAVAANEKRAEKWPLLATNTINDGYLTFIDQVFQFAFNNSAALKNEADGVRVETDLSNKTSAVEVRDPFEVGEFNKIYAAPLYVGARSSHNWHDHGEHHFDRSHRFWMIPAMQFGSFRPQEFGQLHLADIKEVGDYPCIEVTTEVDSEDYVGASEELIKKLKTRAARRTIPVHPILIALGFLEYVEKLRAQSEVRLFPKLEAGSDGTYSSIISKEFNAEKRFLDRVQLKSDTKVLYSARHSFKDALRQGDFSERDQDYLMGHANSGVSETYGSKKIFAPLIDRFLKHLHYPGLDLSKILDGRGRPAFRLERLTPAVRRRLDRLQVDLGMYLP